jgi:hypothetical protein
LPLSIVIAAIRAPLFFTPFARSSHSSRTTVIPCSRTMSSNTFSAALGSKIHIVRCAPSIAGVPCPVLPYSDFFCQRHAASAS